MARPDGTSIIAPSGASGGNLLSPGQGYGQLLPHGYVWPHFLPNPQDFHISGLAVPSASKALVPSVIHGAPPASGGPGGILPDFQGGIATPLVTPGGIGKNTQRALGDPFGKARRYSRVAVGKVSTGVQRVGGNIGLSGRGIRPLGIRWG